jgi:hypothetical protein
MTLAYMLTTFASDLQFTDPRDRVFGLLGMVSDIIARQVNVDYTIPWEEVYSSAIKRIVYSGNLNSFHDIPPFHPIPPILVSRP